jgi:ribosomal protein S15P/S13E
MGIRYDKKLNQEMNRIIRNFNQKISRLEKQNKELLLPNKVTKQEIKSNVHTRKELLRKLQELKRYSKRDIEKTIILDSGVAISKYENIKIEARRLKQSLASEINIKKVKPIRVGGILQDSTFAQSGDKNYLNLVARYNALNKHFDNLDADEIKRYKMLINKSKRNSRYYDNIFMGNYLKALDDTAWFYGYDEKKIEKIKDKLLILDSKDFAKLFTEDKVVEAILDYNMTEKSRLKKRGINVIAVRNDVINLFDTLYEKIDVILEEYEKAK